MILFKKTHAEQLLHLALALSLLRSNPGTYEQWPRQLTAHRPNHWHHPGGFGGGGGGDDDGLQLELPARPAQHYPYANRKAGGGDDEWLLPPLIEDLVHLTRFRRHLDARHDIQTYLLNIHSEPADLEVVASAPNDTQTVIVANGGGGTVLTSSTLDATAGGGVGVDGIATSPLSEPVDLLGAAAAAAAGFSDLDLFLHDDHFTDSASLLDLNLADLRDYEELIMPPMPPSQLVPLPLKDEMPDILAAGTGFTFRFGAARRAAEEERDYDDDDDGFAAAAARSSANGFDAELWTGATNQSSSSSDEDGPAAAAAVDVVVAKPDWSQFYDMVEPGRAVGPLLAGATGGDSPDVKPSGAIKVEADEGGDAVAVPPMEIKLERADEEELLLTDVKSESDGANSTSSGFVSTVELTQEVVVARTNSSV